MTTIDMIVTPAVGLIDEPLHILVRNLPPLAEVTIRASLRDDRGTPWNSSPAVTLASALRHGISASAWNM